MTQHTELEDRLQDLAHRLTAENARLRAEVAMLRASLRTAEDGRAVDAMNLANALHSKATEYAAAYESFRLTAEGLQRKLAAAQIQAAEREVDQIALRAALARATRPDIHG